MDRFFGYLQGRQPKELQKEAPERFRSFPTREEQERIVEAVKSKLNVLELDDCLSKVGVITNVKEVLSYFDLISPVRVVHVSIGEKSEPLSFYKEMYQQIKQGSLPKALAIATTLQEAAYAFKSATKSSRFNLAIEFDETITPASDTINQGIYEFLSNTRGEYMSGGSPATTAMYIPDLSQLPQRTNERGNYNHLPTI